MKGKFIVLEGPDGAGHGTQAKLLTSTLRNLGREVVHTREPGGTPLGEKIRDMLRHPAAGEEPTPRTEVFLCGAFRAQHVDALIRPSVEAGKLVLSERYFYSTLAYQCAGRGVDRLLVDESTELAINDMYPDLVVVLDLPAEVGLARKHKDANNGGPKLDRFEMEALEFHERVRQEYLHQARRYGFPVVDATQSIEEVSADVLQHVLKVLGEAE